VPLRPSSTPGKNAPDMSFIMLTDSQVFPDTESPAPTKSVSNRRRSSYQPVGQPGDDDSLSGRMETATRLFEILSARSDIDHPICVECTERLVDQLQKRLNNSTRERDAYVDFLRQANADVPTNEELSQARQDLKKIQAQELAAFAELERLEKEKATMEAEILDLEAQSRELDIQEEKFWADRNDFSSKLSNLQNERDRLNNQYDHDSKQLERLRRANVYNDTFPIGHDGYFGTINGLRLGRLPERPVDWGEINAAWGHTCLLLVTVAEKLNYTFKGYELLPQGSTSKMKQYKTPRNPNNDPTHPTKPRSDTYKLYNQGEALSTLGGLFHSEFDSAMIAFLECLRQLIEHAHRTPIEMPDGTVVECPRISYKIEKDRIGDHSIRLSGLGNQESEWTKACKLTLICCKFLLAHASNASETRRNR
jgi:beclin 1